MNEGSCELPDIDVAPTEIDEILAQARTVAVVGVSDKPDRDSYRVAAYLQRHGVRIVPINPALGEVLGEKTYPDLASVPPEIAIDVVDIFRKPEFIPEIVEAAIARPAKVVWMQLGLAHNRAAERARAAGLTVVMNRCIKVEHARRHPDGP